MGEDALRAMSIDTSDQWNIHPSIGWSDAIPHIHSNNPYPSMPRLVICELFAYQFPLECQIFDSLYNLMQIINMLKADTSVKPTSLNDGLDNLPAFGTTLSYRYCWLKAGPILLWFRRFFDEYTSRCNKYTPKTPTKLQQKYARFCKCGKSHQMKNSRLVLTRLFLHNIVCPKMNLHSAVLILYPLIAKQTTLHCILLFVHPSSGSHIVYIQLQWTGRWRLWKP